MMNALKTVDKRINCKCGKTHSVGVDKIIIDSDVHNHIGDYIKEIIPCGNIALVSYDDIEYANDIRHGLRKDGYKITEVIFPPFTRFNQENAQRIIDLEDKVLLVIGVGSGALCDLLKYACSIRQIPFVYIMTAPSTDSYLSSIAYLDSDRLIDYQGIAPITLIADISLQYPRALIAAGLSTLYSRLMGIYDIEYQHLVSGGYICNSLIDRMKKSILEFYSEPFNHTSKDYERLTRCIIDISLDISYLGEDAPVMCEDMLARLIRIKNNNCPSAPLIAAYTINNIYYYYLRHQIPDISIPPDKTIYCSKLKELYNINDIDFLLNYKELSDDLYLRISYTTDLKKNELLSKLNHLVPNPSKMVHMALDSFIDKGYHMSKIIDYSDLMRITALSAELTDKMTLIKYIDKRGLLCHYV